MRIATTLSTLTFVVLLGCATTSSVRDAPRPPDTSQIPPVTSRIGIGHVCPLEDRLALTAEHVETWHAPLAYWTVYAPVPLMTAIDGRPATLFHVWADMRRDLAMVAIRTPGVVFPRHYSLSQREPKPGERLWLQGFDMEAGFLGKRYEVIVLRHEFGQLYFKHRTEMYPGGSGSCVLNADEEVVAIYTGAYPIKKKQPTEKQRFMGNAELVAGPWGTIDPEYLR